MKKRNLLFALVAPLLITSCSTIKAVFPEKDNALTNTTLNLSHNTLETIYKKIKDGGSFTSDVKELLSKEIAVMVLGDYEVVAAGNEKGFAISLKDYESSTDKQGWIKSHKAYYNWDHTGYKLTLDEEKVPTENEFLQRVQLVKDLIEEKVLETLWNEINTSSYKRNNRLYEVSYAKNIYDRLYNVLDVDGNVITSGSDAEDFLYKTPDYTSHYTYAANEKFNGFKEFDANSADALDEQGFTRGLLIDHTYVTNTAEGRAKIASAIHVARYLDYINNSILPSILNNLLVEQYVLQEQYSAIGSTQNRKVNYIKIENNKSKDAKAFLISLIDDYFFDTVESPSETSTTTAFRYAETAWKGVYDEIKPDSPEARLASIFGSATDRNPSIDKDGHEGGAYIDSFGDERALMYYENTEYADLIEDFSTLTHDIATNNSSNTSKFTSINSITYDPIVGFAIKTDEIRVKSFKTYGWQVKDSSGLPDAAKNKLYSYGLANEWNAALTKDSAYIGSYILQNNARKSFLMKDSYVSKEDSILWQDGDNFYLIEVEDIITPELVAIDANTTDTAKANIEAKARNQAYKLASDSTYSTNALTYYLKQCNISYHDQTVYDYFVSNFPKLFE